MYKLNNINGFVQEMLFPSYLIKPFWGVVIGAAISAVGAASSASEALSAGQDAASARQARVDAANEAYASYKEKFTGNEMELVESVDNFTMRDNLEKYRTEGVVQTEAAFAQAQEAQTRRMGRYGISPESQRFSAESSELGLEKAKTKVQELNRARTTAEEERIEDEDKLFSRRLAVANLGRREDPGMTAMMGAYGAQAAGFGAESTAAAESASAGYGVTGEFIGEAIDSFGTSDSSTADSNSLFNEPSWEGSNSVSDSDTGELGW